MYKILYKNFSLFLENITRFLEKILVIFLKTDLYLLEFFGRRKNYIFFLFAFFFGTFNNSTNISDLPYSFQVFLFLFFLVFGLHKHVCLHSFQQFFNERISL
nr:hypothetical protein [Trebouxia sp. A1-2]